MTTIARGDLSRIGEPRTVIVRDREAWRALWREHAGSADPPAVEFDREMVVAVFAGERPTAGYRVEIVRLFERSGKVVVAYRDEPPPRDAVVAQVITQPFHLVRTSRSDLPLVFEKITQ